MAEETQETLVGKELEVWCRDYPEHAAAYIQGQRVAHDHLRQVIADTRDWLHRTERGGTAHAMQLTEVLA